jgi:hypothetical protein
MAFRQILWIIGVLSFYFFASATPDTTSAAPKQNAAKTVKAGKFTFSYTVAGKNLSATLSYPANGWVAVGFNPKNVMQDANFIMGTIVNGKAILSDEFGDGMFSHVADTAVGGASNIISGDVRQDSGVTTMTFVIPLDSGDPKDSKLTPGQKIKLIFANGTTNDIRKKHKNDAKITITL